ncbi:hypothetical protein NDU88_003221 [Pleurodeles waltl]|uniref:Uncharacterized protein n=1 Tax=Pleurodeles waltl TaxID=8319 RepID=A0AAV7UBX0_PLEWA|nr:hypothetical protein NDU88_003221 [Pleurodeles waltl]
MASTGGGIVVCKRMGDRYAIQGAAGSGPLSGDLPPQSITGALSPCQLIVDPGIGEGGGPSPPQGLLIYYLFPGSSSILGLLPNTDADICVLPRPALVNSLLGRCGALKGLRAPSQTLSQWGRLRGNFRLGGLDLTSVLLLFLPTACAGVRAPLSAAFVSPLQVASDHSVVYMPLSNPFLGDGVSAGVLGILTSGPSIPLLSAFSVPLFLPSTGRFYSGPVRPRLSLSRSLPRAVFRFVAVLSGSVGTGEYRDSSFLSGQSLRGDYCM